MEGSSQPGREAWKSVAGVGAKARREEHCGGDGAGGEARRAP